ncbi:adenosine receptor A2b-like [Asterias amurensis]|uniref:adenosine receptor A2b-like n=1 Tax=Asterias amurensis TaxID=7602 RepID=UPI003AB5EB3A
MASNTSQNDLDVTSFPLSNSQVFVLLVFDCLLSLAITVGNLLVVSSVILERKLRTPTNAFIASLAVADLTVGLIVIPIDIAFALGFASNVTPIACLASSNVLTVMIMVSILHLTIIAFDRYLAITDPLTYVVRMSVFRVALLIALAWGTAIGISSMPLFGWNNLSNYNHDYCDLMFIHAHSYRAFTVAVSVFVPQNLMLYFYFKMFRVAKGHMNRIAAQEQTTARRPTLRRDVKAAKTVAMILGFFLMAWTPASLISVLDTFIHVDDNLQRTLLIYELACFHLAFTNSMMNPIIYSFRNKDFRHAFMKLLGHLFRCRCWRKRVFAASKKADASCFPEIPTISRTHHDDPEDVKDRTGSLNSDGSIEELT